MARVWDSEFWGDEDIAIVGMAAHLPGAADVDTYWKNLCAGLESIRHLSPEELLANGESPARMRSRNFVPAAATLDRFEWFDAEFFGLSPKEAAIMDPQHRQFLEVAWEALEDAGHPPEKTPGSVGVFAGCGMGSYFYFNLCSNAELLRNTGMFLLRHTGNDKDFLSTRVSHVFDLKGPSLGIQTACSTSLVAVHVACQSLLNRECDMALAGGVTIELPHGRGYIYEDGEILSPDGHCHAFDHRAQGTVFGSGAGCVVLRRLKDALADGDHIWAVIKGTAINNDGSAKAGYLAPSVDGQARCVAEAHAVAGLSAETIGYVECHGTGTYLGDPIEIAALSQAFAQTTDKIGYSRVGSVKTNIGHLDTAAGVASLIKASLAVHHGEIPPSLGYEAPNPAIDFDASPFRVNDRLSAFPDLGTPRRAGVNSLGVGGTNAHAVVQEPPPRAISDESDWPFQLLVLSARNKAALDATSVGLAAHLRAHPEQPLADVAWTLKEGRRAFERRRVLVAETHAEAADLLEQADRHRVFTHQALDNPEVVFMFPGGGAQYVGMARDLYHTEPVFRDWMDRGLDYLQPKLDYDLRELWLPEPGHEEQAAERLKRPSVQLPLIMIVEYALAQLWIGWGVTPAALVGHSMGENTAACLAGVMSFEDCIGLVHLRGQLFDTIDAGGMLSVPLTEAKARDYMGDCLDMAAVNAPELCVVSGPQHELDRMQAKLAADGIEAQRIAIDIAAHSRMLEPILKRFGDYLRAIRLSPPSLPIISNRNGKALGAAQAIDPEYWVYHLRSSVMFANCIETLKAEPNRVYLEVGPGKALSSLAQANGVSANQVISSLRHPDHVIADDVNFITTLGRLWALGVEVDWAQIWGEGRRQRVRLPTYPFQRQPYFIEPQEAVMASDVLWPERLDDVADWGWTPHWQPQAAAADAAPDALDAAKPSLWLIFIDSAGVGADATRRLRAAGHRVIEVRAGDMFSRLGPDQFTLAPERGREGYDTLLQELVAQGVVPSHIAHFWLVTQDRAHRPGSSFLHRNLEQGFYSLMFLAQAVAEENLPRPLHITVFTTGAQARRDERLADPEKAAVQGPLRVIPREFPGVTCASLDLDLSAQNISDTVIEELLAAPANGTAMLRSERRFGLTLRHTLLTPAQAPIIPSGAVVMLTGGFGGIGLTLAEDMVRNASARLVLVARRSLPDPGQWDEMLRSEPTGLVADRIRAVRHLETLGAEVLVLSADVCNLEEIRAARAAAEARFGKVDVLIHAAGVVDDAPILAKTPAAVEEVFAPKLHGTQVLSQVFPDGDLRLMVLFASTSTVTAPAGQVDYVAANEYLNAFAQSRVGGRTLVLALNWGIWADVGMAAEAVMGRRPASALPVCAPMLDTATFDANGARLLVAQWGVDNWWLDEHRTGGGEALVPGTGYLDLIAQGLQAQGESHPFEISDLYFFRPLAINENETREVRLTLSRSDGGYGVQVRSDVLAAGRRGFTLNAQAEIGFSLRSEDRPGALDIAAASLRCDAAIRRDEGGLPSPQETRLTFGPRWRVLRETRLGTGEGLARLSLDARFADDLQGHVIHPALMDIATGWAMDLIPGYRPDHLWVPVSYGRIKVWQSLPSTIWSHVRSASANHVDAPFASFDITIADAEGRVCIEVEGFQIKRLDGAFDLALAPDAREVQFDQNDEARAQSPAEERLRHNLSQGIPADLGPEAFSRALALGAARVIVSSMDLPALIRQSDEAQVAAAAGQSFARPDLDSAYVAPRNDIERTLAGFWQELLGVAQVGVEDSFFDLGGHSLIAVRLFAMIRKSYAVDFPISVLFEAPTIAACAALIHDRIGPTESGAQVVAVKPARRFTHIVPMHQGEGGTQRPFFLVAGMFGNVLNLRHLAQLLGTDRPFYGLQARGLFGDDAPHGSFVEAARDQIAEIRQVQPHGPYLLGGFSGGGLIAWEIARQLAEAGEDVAQIVLLDTPLPMRPTLSRSDKALIKLAELRGKGLGYLAEWARTRLEWERRKRAPALVREDGPHLHNEAIEAAFRAALPAYEMLSWPGRVALFRPPLDLHWQVSGGRWVSRAREYVFSDNDFGRYAPNLEVIEVPGDHDSMVLEPNVRVLAMRLKRVIAEAEAEANQKRAAE